MTSPARNISYEFLINIAMPRLLQPRFFLFVFFRQPSSIDRADTVILPDTGRGQHRFEGDALAASQLCRARLFVVTSCEIRAKFYACTWSKSAVGLHVFFACRRGIWNKRDFLGALRFFELRCCFVSLPLSGIAKALQILFFLG